MRVEPYSEAMLSDLTTAFNRAVAQVPHCYPVGEAEMAAALAPALGGAPGDPRLRSEAVLVAREGSALRGFAHTAVRKEKDGPADVGVIRFLWYERGFRAVGQALLAAAEERLRRAGLDRVLACHCDDGYRFYHVRYGHLSDHLEHVQALLKLAGYDAVDGEVVLDWPSYAPPAPEPPEADVRVTPEWSVGRGRLPNVSVKARLGGAQIGTCDCISCGEFTADEAAQDWLFVNGLFINDEHQGKGLGRHLLQRALAEMHGVGYRNASISTDWRNHRALLFYSNYGFHMVDWTFCYARPLR